MAVRAYLSGKKKNLLTLTTAIAAAAAMQSSVLAAVVNWTGASGTDTNWGTPGNWSGTDTPPANSLTADQARFDLTDYTGKQPNLDATYNINGLIFGDGTTTTGSLTFTGGTLFIGSGGITMNANAGPVNMITTGGIGLYAPQTWTLSSTNNLTYGNLNRNGGNGVTLNIVYNSTGVVTTQQSNDANTGLLLSPTYEAQTGAPWITVTTATGTYYATNTTNVSGGAIGAYTSGLALTNVNSIGAVNGQYENDEISGATLTNNVLAASATTNTIRYTGAAQTLQLGDATHSNVTLNVNGILNSGTGKLTISDGTSGHTGALGFTRSEMVLDAASGDIEVAAPLVANSGSARSITVAGAHHVMLNSVVNNGTGTLSFNGLGAVFYIGSSGNLVLNAANGQINLTTSLGNDAGTNAPIIADNPTFGPSTVEISGTHPVVLSGNSTYTGGTIIDAGATLDLSPRFYGSGFYNIGYGPLTINAGATITTTGDNEGVWEGFATPMTWNGSWTMANAGVSFASDTSNDGPYGTVLLNAPGIVFTQNGNQGVNMGSVSDGGHNYGFTIISTVAGASALSLDGTNSFTGTLTLGDGTNSGAVNLDGSSPAWAGNIVITSTGSLFVGSAGGLGNSTVTINGGVLAGTETAFTGSSHFIVHNSFTFGEGGYNEEPDFTSSTFTFAPTTGNSITMTLNQDPSHNSGYVSLGTVVDHGANLIVQDAGTITGSILSINSPSPDFYGTLTITNGAGVQLGSNQAVNRSVDIVVDAGSTFAPRSYDTMAQIAGVDDGAHGGGLVDGGTNGDRTLALTGSGNHSFSGVIGGSSAYGGGILLFVAGSGSGTQTLSGANTYQNNTWMLSGNLNLNFNAAGAPQNNILYHNTSFSNGTADIVPFGLVFGGGTLTVTGSSTQAVSQSFTSISSGNAAYGLPTGGGRIRVVSNGQDTAVLFGAISHGEGGAMNFVLPSGSQTATNGILTTTTNEATGIIGGYATVTSSAGQTDWAVSGVTEQPADPAGTVGNPGTWDVDDNGFTVIYGTAANGTAVAFDTINGSGSGLVPGQIYYVVGSDGTSEFKVTTAPGATTPISAAAPSGTQSLTIDKPGNIAAYTAYAPLVGDGTDAATANAQVTASLVASASTTVNSLKIANSATGTLNLGSNSLTLVDGGLLFTGTADYTITGGYLRSVQDANGIYIQQYGTGKLIINSTIVAGQYGGDGYGDALVKSGPGTLVLTGANLFGNDGRANEGLYLNEGITNINGVAAIGYSGAVWFNGGTLQYQSPTVGPLVDNGDITSNPLAPSAPVLIESGGATIDTNGNNITWANNFGGADSFGLIENGTDIPTGPLTKTGAGTLTLQGIGSYTGATTISGGTLAVATLANGGAPSSIGFSNSSPNNLILDGGTLQYTGGATNTDRNFTVTANGGTLDASGTGAEAFTNTGAIAVTGAGARTLTLTGTSTATNSLGLVVGDGTDGSGGTLALAKTGTGVWALSNANTFSGGTTVSSGTLLASNTTGSATGTANVTMNGGTLGGAGKISGTIVGGTGAHTIAPSATLVGNTATTLTVGGVTTDSHTTLAFNLNTPYNTITHAASVNDKLVVNGTVNTTGGGSVAITANNTGQPSLGYYKAIAYTTLTAPTTPGTANLGLTMPTIVPAIGIAYTLDTSHDPGYIDIHRGFLGDANDDGIVNAVDLGILATYYNSTTANWSEGDYNGDGIVNAVDLGILATYYNGVVGAGSFDSAVEAYPTLEAALSGASSVPEPASLALLGLGAAALLTRRRRRA